MRRTKGRLLEGALTSYHPSSNAYMAILGIWYLFPVSCWAKSGALVGLRPKTRAGTVKQNLRKLRGPLYAVGRPVPTRNCEPDHPWSTVRAGRHPPLAASGP